MQTATITDLRAGVAEYMGTASMPLGNQAAYDKSIKAGLDYVWRYTTWAFSVKRDEPLAVISGKYYMPADFDILGWRDLGVEEYSTTDGHTFDTDRGLTPRGVYLVYDEGTSRFQVVGAAPSMTVSYQAKPPETNGVITFPSLDVLYIAGAIFQKQKDNPNSADTTQLWDLLHQKLDQLSGQAYFNTPHHRPRNRYEQYNTYIGDTR
jgi:hypothetical protein